MSKPKLCARCGQPIAPSKAKAGRPPKHPLADPAASEHFRAWLSKRANGLGLPATEFCAKNALGPALSIHHLRKALSGDRPFYEVELSKLVAYAKKSLGYSGYTLPPVISAT